MLDVDLMDIGAKIMGICDNEGLQYDFLMHNFPIIARITPTEDRLDQMTLLEDENENNYVNGEILFIFADELTVQIKNDFIISDDLMNKLKNNAKKMHYIFLQKYFKDRKERENNKTKNINITPLQIQEAK